MIWRVLVGVAFVVAVVVVTYLAHLALIEVIAR